MKIFTHYNITLIILLLCFNFYSQAARSVTYTAIASGSYTNTTTVWSTNGTTACGCAPPVTLGNKDLIVINSGITVTATATTNIESGNSNGITVNGAFTINGSLTTGNSSTIDVNANSIFNITDNLIIDQNSGTMTVQPNGQLNIGGDFEAKNGSTFIIEAAGTFDVTGDFDVLQNSNATINGDVAIGGNTTFSSNVRMTLDGSFMIDGTLDVTSFKDLFGTGEIGIGGVSCGNINCTSDCAGDINTENGTNSGGGSTATDLLCENFGTAGVLPVKFIHFSNTVNNNVTLLAWSTAEEINNSHFIIEESFDGKSFTDKGIVEGVGNSAITQNYSFSLASNNQTTYYRLKQVDIDGKTDYSKTIVETYQLGEFVIYPNPSSQNVNCTLTSYEGNTIVQITNEFGLVISDEIYNTSIANDINFSIITKGIYFIKVIQGNDMTIKKLVIH